MKRFVPPGWAVLALPNFRRLWLAQTGSVIGDGFHAIAIVWLTFETLGGGPQALALLGIAQLVPHLALGILSGTIVDRLDRRHVMIAADLIRAALVGVLALFVAAGYASVTLVIAIGTAHTLAGLLFYPARNAALPSYVPKDQLVSANGLRPSPFPSVVPTKSRAKCGDGVALNQAWRPAAFSIHVPAALGFHVSSHCAASATKASSKGTEAMLEVLARADRRAP